MMQRRILFVATHPKEAPSTRNRVFAYEPALRQAGFDVEIQTFFPSEALDAINAERRWLRKISWVLNGTWQRWNALRTGRHELIFIHRELFPWGMPVGMALLMAQIHKRKIGLIYDFDDAVFLPHRQDRPVIGKLEDATSTQTLMRMSHVVIAGNAYLADHARQLNDRVVCLPTPVDTTRFVPDGTPQRRRPVIGWIGSPSTAKYLHSLEPVLQRLAQTHAFQLKVVGAGAGFAMARVPLDNRPWRLASETEEFRGCDIGLYPLWDDAWSRGKCGFKALQFMASGVPVVASALGMNTEIIRDRANGMLARSPEEWLQRLTELLEDASLRRALGAAGRATVEQRYSLQHLTPTFLTAVHTALQRAPAPAPATARAAATQLPDAATPPREAERQDILCFSSIDWDFIWQGHQEIMSTLARQGHRVLFVENTGVRNPQLRDLPRIRRRLAKSWGSMQGFHQEQENLYVFSPLVLPFPYLRPARWINRRLMLVSLRRWMQATGFYQPVCWTFLPTPITLDVLRRIPHKALIYYCIDSFSDSTPAARRIIASEQRLLQEADLVFVTSRQLYERAAAHNARVHLFPFGVSFAAFERALALQEPPPPELRGLTGPIVGYVGGVHQWVDQDLLVQAARAHPAHQFVLIGPLQTNVERLRQERNIHLIGQRPHEALPRYINHFDVGIVPYRLTDYTNKVYPTKLNEYHAMGKPVVSMALPEVEAFNHRHGALVYLAATAEMFGAQLQRALAEDAPALRARRIAAARENSWSRRIDTMQGLIAETVAQKASQLHEHWADRLKASLQRSRLIVRSAVVLALLAGALVGTPLPWWLARPLTMPHAPQAADAIVVFGGGVGESGQAGESSQERVKHAVELFRQGYAQRLLLVSGQTRTFDETQVMRALSEAMGVPPSSILVETRVRHTHDYVQRVRAVSGEHAWQGILLVTSPYHARRAALTFAKHAPALRIAHSPVRSSRFYAHRRRGMSLRQMRGIAQEYVAIVYYWLRGWI